MSRGGTELKRGDRKMSLRFGQIRAPFFTGSHGGSPFRDKTKREVDFIVARDGEPWFLVEAKKSDTGLSGNLDHFQRQTGARHAFQVVVDAEYVDRDCFSYNQPIVVPARTFLSQLL